MTTFNNQSISPEKQMLGRLACSAAREALGSRVSPSAPTWSVARPRIGIEPGVIRIIPYSVDDAYFLSPTVLAAPPLANGWDLPSMKSASAGRDPVPAEEPEQSGPCGWTLFRRGLPVRLLLAGR